MATAAYAGIVSPRHGEVLREELAHVLGIAGLPQRLLDNDPHRDEAVAEQDPRLSRHADRHRLVEEALEMGVDALLVIRGELADPLDDPLDLHGLAGRRLSQRDRDSAACLEIGYEPKVVGERERSFTTRNLPVPKRRRRGVGRRRHRARCRPT